MNIAPLILAAQVCVLIDVADTNPEKYPNIASEVENHLNSFEVFHGKVTCFDLSKQYYMQYHLFDRPGEVWYGTKCKYVPKESDEGKTLVYHGQNGSSICPIVDTKPWH